MKKIALFLIAGLVLSCNADRGRTFASLRQARTMENPAQAKDGVFVHISEGYNDPHRVLMPMKMAEIMSDDKPVVVYLDMHAVELLVKNAKDMNYTGFDSFHTYLRHLLDKKVSIYVCPTCLSVAGFRPEDLIEGVQIAKKEKFFDFTNGRIVTLNY